MLIVKILFIRYVWILSIQAKQYFQAQKIAFEEIDVNQNSQAAQEMVKLSGQMGVPVIVIDKKVIVGFDQKEIERVLNIKQ